MNAQPSFAAMDRFWIARNGGNAEGPFSEGQVRGMFTTGGLTLDDLICADDGKESWRPISNELGWIDVPTESQPQKSGTRLVGAGEAGFRRGNTAAAFRGEMEKRDAATVKGCERAIFWLMLLMIGTAFVPGLGLLTWPLTAVVGLVIVILAVVQITKGAASKGVWNLLLGIVFLPIAVVVIQLIVLGAVREP
jgi:hypothetical protein